MNSVLESVKENKLVVIYRGYTPQQCLELTRVLYDAGIRLFEVTMNSAQAIESIELLSKEFNDQVAIGAGTVLSADEVDQAESVGAKYIISPNINIDVISRTKELGLISVPGAFSPSEIQTAVETGADIVKLFPINVLGVDYLKQVKGPLDKVLFMPSGGINLALAEQLFASGSIAIGLGVQMFGKEAIESKDWATLTSNAKQFAKAAGLNL